ncbi:hypothetical protein Sm713_22020 [Streptomyces sp. TS71-3]|nr:hypothetical protein Sm713_22020 [Streptomyces sp. TS71-3]
MCLEKPTFSPNSARLRPACSRNPWTAAPKVRRLSEDSRSMPVVPEVSEAPVVSVVSVVSLSSVIADFLP